MPTLLAYLETEAFTLTLVTLAVAMLCEMRWPRRAIPGAWAGRWGVNAVLAGAGMAMVGALIPLSSVTAAALAERRGLGLFPLTGCAAWMAGALGFLLLDLVKFLQHLLMHRIGWLWRVHRAHHADAACDATTSLRFHPFEMLLAHALELATILALGIPPLAVALYRLARTVVSTVVHGNFTFPRAVERALRWIVVTPDLHLIHHSQLPREQHCNLSGGLTLWDRLFGTYLPEPSISLERMPLGIAGLSVARANSLRAMPSVFEANNH